MPNCSETGPAQKRSETCQFGHVSGTVGAQREPRADEMCRSVPDHRHVTPAGGRSGRRCPVSRRTDTVLSDTLLTHRDGLVWFSTDTTQIALLRAARAFLSRDTTVCAVQFPASRPAVRGGRQQDVLDEDLALRGREAVMKMSR